MLKSLELLGFKSFADRTKFDFAAGITGVVGPNGSGKSNVVDAIKWILGDQSAKSLRGKEMIDVIFNGAAGRKASAFAEATLTFDNSAGLLPIESHEVHVGRRLWRNGDSEYLINRAPSRLKDVRELFLGTGAGASAYCIIEQGRVDQILQANATSRRQVFEEAAGISRYKARKNEALRKLERVEQNLLRLTDIVDEVEARRNSLRSQAARAAKFRDVSEELRRWWLGLAADDFRHLSQQLEATETESAEFQKQAEQFRDCQQQHEHRLEAIDAEIADIDDRLRAVERQRAANRERIAGHQATIGHQTARQTELEVELARLRKQRLMIETRVHEIAAELEHNKRVLDSFEGNFANRQREMKRQATEVRERAERLQTQRQRIDAQRDMLLRQMHAVSSAGSRVAGIQSQLESLAESKKAAVERQRELDDERVRCDAVCRQLRSDVEDVKRQLDAAARASRGIEEQRQALSGEQGGFQQALARLRERRSTALARKTVLEDLEARQEGIGIGVKEILNRAETSHYPPWNGILGSVADLIDVDLEHAALLELALGSRAQLIVIDGLQSLIDYLNSDSCRISGRVGFVSSSDCAPVGNQGASSDSLNPGERKGRDDRFRHFHRDASAFPDLMGRPGVVERADRLVQLPDDLPNLAEQLLADTWIVETLDGALELSRGPGHGCRFVTLQGELLSADGTLYVGTVNSESGLVSRKSELRRLKDDLFNLDRKIADEEFRLSQVDDTLSRVHGQLKDMSAQTEELAARHSKLRSNQIERERELASVRRELTEMVRRQERQEAQTAELKDALQHAEQDAAREDEDLRTAQADVQNAERDLARQEHELRLLEAEVNAEQLDVAKQEERLAALRESHARFREELLLRTSQRDEAQRRLNASVEKHRQIALHVLNSQSVVAGLFLQEEAFARDATALLAEKNARRGRRTTLQKEHADARRRRNDMADRQHQADMQARDIRHRLSALDERISEEYQVPLSDVVQSGASALGLYLAERLARARERDDSRAPVDAELDAATRQYEPAELSAELSNHVDDELADAITFSTAREELESRVNRLRRKLKLMGSVNTDSLSDLDELEQRYSHLKAQLDDLVEAKSALEDIVRKINAESKRLFAETYDTVRGHFQELFRKLFGGGEGDVVLEDPNDVLECGIDIVARPPGKELRSISLLSGGEKTMTAVALLLAIFKSRPSPFCILDECDAALDEANIDRFIGILKDFQHSTQFILVTHRKPTMTVCDILYGVTMEQSGVSKRMSVRFEDVDENGEFAAASTGLNESNEADAGPMSAAA